MVVFVLLGLSLAAWAETQGHDPDEGTLSSIRPRIPEPMVFDLIRPLGAKKGEVEVNSLFRFSPTQRPRRLLWAPEVEYTFLDGYGIEFELPLENGTIDTYKGAIQGTLPGPWNKKFIHGWQGIGEVAREDRHWHTDLLYLAGARWHRRWSTLTMTGVRTERARETKAAFLGNYSVFYHFRKELSYGLESNFKGNGLSGRYALLMPQAHFRRNRVNVQVGAGWNRVARRGALQIGWRVSREF